MSATQPIQDSYWVIPGKLLAGEYPGGGRENATRARLRWLLEQHVTVFLDLTEGEAEGLAPYSDWLTIEAQTRGQPAAHVSFPIPDMTIPDKANMVLILDGLDLILRSGRTAYVHCYAGVGRTGVAIGCFLVRHGFTPQEALAQIAVWRQELPGGWRQSPETDEQTEFVMNWRKDQ